MGKKQQDEDYDIVDEEVSICGYVSPHIALLFGSITDKQAADVVTWIIASNINPEPPKELVIVINSPGGSASAAFAIIEAMRGCKIPIKTVALGQICSAGLLIFMNGSKKHRVITPSCSIMSHQFYTTIGGTYHELINTTKELDYVHQRILDSYLQCTGKSISYVDKHLLNPHDAWLSPDEAVKHKLGDVVQDISVIFGN